MKKTFHNYFLVIIFLGSLSSITAQYTLVPDPNFETYMVNNGWDDVVDGQVLTANISGVSFVFVFNSNISDLTGIEDFSSLTLLMCGDNNLTNLNLSGLSQLGAVYCGNNQLTYLDVTNCTNLETIEATNNNLSSLDVSTNSSLTFLACGSNNIGSLDLSYNGLLDQLYCDYNQLTSLDLSGNPFLREVTCGQQFDATTKISNLNISNCNNLEMLYCMYNDLTSLDVSNRTSLSKLYCQGNSLTTLNLNNCPSLSDVMCMGNQLTGTLDLSNHSQLKQLNCSNTGYTNLNVSNCTVLDTVYAASMQNLQYLDASFCPSLLKLDCGNSFSLAPSMSISLTGDVALYDLDCSGETFKRLELTSLDLSDCLNLTYLDCRSCALTSLDMSNHASLDIFLCEDNYLTSLNIQNGNNQNMTAFSALTNPSLTCIQVDNPTWANTNWSLNKDLGATYSLACSLVELNEMKTNELEISPNPTIDKLILSNIEGLNNYFLVNQLGQEVQSGLLENFIDVNSIPSGVYLLRMEGEEGTITRRIIKE